MSWSFGGAFRMLFHVLRWAEVLGGTQNAILCFTGAARNLKNLGLTDWTDWLWTVSLRWGGSGWRAGHWDSMAMVWGSSWPSIEMAVYVSGEYLECYFIFWDELKFWGGTQNAILCFGVSWSFWGVLRMLFYVLGWAEVFGGHSECYFMF